MLQLEPHYKREQLSSLWLTVEERGCALQDPAWGLEHHTTEARHTEIQVNTQLSGETHEEKELLGTLPADDPGGIREPADCGAGR